MGRRLVTVVAVAGMFGVAALPAYAQSLDEWLERASDAEFEGRQVTICNTPDGRLSDVVDVAQKDGMVAVGAPDGPVVFQSGVVEPGAIADGSADSERAELAERYSVRRLSQASFLSRPVDVVEVFDGDSVRVSYLFDQETGAILQSEVLHADGSMYCTTQFIEFRTDIDIDLPVSAVADDALVPADNMPDRVGDFVRLDTYAGPHGSTAGFYSDGVFSFTLIAAEVRIEVAEMRDAPQANIAGHTYTRRYAAGQVVYAWETKQGGLVLIGDLPPDIHGEVMGDLPTPGKPSLIVRMWRRIFR